MTLRRALAQNYNRLKERLTRRFGSSDAAVEVLHDMYLRLGSADAAAVVRNADAYLYRVALNVAADRREADRRWSDKAAIAALLQRDDHELDPEEVAEARQEWHLLLRALDTMPRRRQEIFIAARLHEQPHREIAARLGISVDTVDRELKQALEAFAALLGKKWRSRRGPQPSRPS